MTWVDVGTYIVLLCGLSIVTASAYTIRNPQEELGHALHARLVGHDAVPRRVTDPERLQDTRRYGWFGLLMGLLFLAVTFPLGDDLRSLLATVGLCIPLLYVVSTHPIRENVAGVVVLSIATGYGLLVVGTAQVTTYLLAILGGVVGVFRIVPLLSGSQWWPRGVHGQHTFHYRCLSCERAFESNTVNMADARCPQCGPTRVVTVTPGKTESRPQRPTRVAKER